MSAEAQGLDILRERARALAQPETPARAPTDCLELLEFRLAGEHYAVETRFVKEVQPLRELTPLPGTPAFVRGIVNLRGRILPVYDLKKFFGLPEHGLSDLHRIVVLEGDGLELGLLADVVIAVRHLPRDAIAPPPATVSAIAAEFLMGVSEQRLVVLAIDRILADPRIVVNDGDNE
jgi:purine-binding chemotaxis protein CheW